MKVISGKYKGRNLFGYDLEGTRPTMDRVKESLFDILQNEMKDAIVLDLFAGSGNLGIESLSRGAKKVFLVDHNKKATETIKKNMHFLQIEHNEYQILTMDSKKALTELQKEKIQFHLIFLDPPYHTDKIEESIKLITQNHLLSEEGTIICESNQPEKIIYPEEYQETKRKKYGDKYIVLLKRK